MSDPQNPLATTATAASPAPPALTSAGSAATLSTVFRSPRRPLVTTVALALVAMLIAVVPSTAPTQAQVYTSFNFHGAGWGHGVGMSQYGARNMAADGFTAEGILAAYYADVAITQVAPPPGLRVHLGDSPQVRIATYGSITAENSGGVLLTQGPNVDVTMAVSGEGIQFGNLWLPASPSDPVMVSFDSPIRVSTTNDTYLWGKLQLTVRNGKIRVVEADLEMEQYVKGIAEMPSSWPEESLRAQAIAARTYAHFVTTDRRSDPDWEREYDLSASTLDQNYEGYLAAVPAWEAATESTAGLEMLYAGQPIKAYYSASSGGFTESAEYVFGFDLPYTVVGEDRYDGYKNPWFEWTRTYGADELSRWLNRSPETAVGLVQDVIIGTDNVGGSGRIDNTPVQIIGTNGTKVVNGRRFMVILNSGLFSEGGGLDRHLPGTFTRISGDLPRPNSVTELTGTPQSTSAAVVATDAPAEVTLGEGVSSGGEDTAPVLEAAAETTTSSAAFVGNAGAPVTIVDEAGEQQALGELDLLQLGADGQVVATGWAIDPDAPGESLIVDLWVDGRLGADGLAGESHAGLVDRISGSSSDHGFVLAAALNDAGHRQVCVVAREHGKSVGVSLGCRWFHVVTDVAGTGGAAVSAISSDS